jgi:hypothetical protein
MIKRTRNPRTIRSLVELSALPDDAIIGAAEAALLLGRSAETLRRWRLKGLGPSYLRATARPDCAEYRMGDVRHSKQARVVNLGGQR